MPTCLKNVTQTLRSNTLFIASKRALFSKSWPKFPHRHHPQIAAPEPVDQPKHRQVTPDNQQLTLETQGQTATKTALQTLCLTQ